MAFSVNSSGPAADINVTPLIDVLLVLLIIFMVIVPVTPRGLDSSIPQGASQAVQLPPVTVRIIGTDPSLPVVYRVNEQVVAPSQLEASLRALFAVRQDRTLFIQAARDLSYRQVATVVSQARSAGAGAVSLQPAPASKD